MPVDMHKLYDSKGKQHGIINTLPNSVAFKGFDNFKPEHREEMKRKYEHDHEMVDVRYINSKGGNEELNMPWSQWGDNIEQYRFINNHVYTVPKGLLDHIKSPYTNPGMAQRSEILDVHGVPTKKDGANIREHDFFPASF